MCKFYDLVLSGKEDIVDAYDRAAPNGGDSHLPVTAGFAASRTVIDIVILIAGSLVDGIRQRDIQDVPLLTMPDDDAVLDELRAAMVRFGVIGG